MAIPVETFFLPQSGEGTLQQRVQRMIAEGILSGRLMPGARLPSSRKLAEHLKVSRITVTLAYNDLVASEYLVSRERSGHFVSDNAPQKPIFQLAEPESGTLADWSRLIGRRFSDYTTVVRPADWSRYRYPFIYGQVDSGLFDHHNWRQCALQALGQRDFDALTYDYYERDDPMLVEYIIRTILPRRGIRARPEECLITMGGQNALWLAAQVLLTQRRRAVVEDPCFHGLRDILKQTRCETVAVAVDDNGLPPDAIPDGAHAVFTTVSHQCPTNVTMPLDRRRALLSRAANDGFVIVEDDYEFEITHLSTPMPALKAMDEAGSVVYVGSFSKSLFPGLRLGYLVASEEFVREARALRALILRHPPGHIQRTAAYFLSLGYYDAQVTRMDRAYRRRRQAMVTALQEHGLYRDRMGGTGGSSFWMRAPDGIDTARLAMDLRQDGVLIEPGRVFFPPEEDNRAFYRIAYSSIATARIPEGIAILAKRIADG